MIGGGGTSQVWEFEKKKKKEEPFMPLLLSLLMSLINCG